MLERNPEPPPLTKIQVCLKGTENQKKSKVYPIITSIKPAPHLSFDDASECKLHHHHHHPHYRGVLFRPPAPREPRPLPPRLRPAELLEACWRWASPPPPPPVEE